MRRVLVLAAVMVGVLGLSPAGASALPAGSLDPSFGTGGTITPDAFPMDNDALVKATRDAQGRIVLAGIYGPSCPCAGDVFVMRLKPDGTPDPTFSGDGIFAATSVGGDFVVRGVAVQPSGRILVAYDDSGTGNPQEWSIVGLTEGGALDVTTFGTGGVVTLAVPGFLGGIAVDAAGKIVVAGENNFDFEVHRFTANGVQDPDWNGNAPVVADFGTNSDTPFAVGLGADGKVVVAGQTFDGAYNKAAVLRLTSTGAPDAGFDTDGEATVDFGADFFAAADVGVMGDGRVVVGGFIPDSGALRDLVVGRLKNDGTPDNTFSGDGQQILADPAVSDEVQTLMVQSDGKVLLGGLRTPASPFFPGAVYRYTAAGVLDTTFSGDGRVDLPVGSSHQTTISAVIDGGANTVLAVGSTFDGLAAPPDDDDTGYVARILTEADNCPGVADPDQTDTDGDGDGNPCDADDDGDGLSDAVEIAIGSNPLGTDSDSDGKPDSSDACPTLAGTEANGCPAAPAPPSGGGGGGGGGGTDPPRVDPPAVVDRAGPRLGIQGLASRIARKTFLAKGVTITVATDEPASLEAELIGTLKGVRVARPGDVVLASKTLGLGGGARKITFKLGKAQKKLIGKTAKIVLRITATDASGNRTRVSRTFRVR